MVGEGGVGRVGQVRELRFISKGRGKGDGRERGNPTGR